MADDEPQVFLVFNGGYNGRRGTPRAVDSPEGTWVDYSFLWEEHRVPRGRLDKWVREGVVHYRNTRPTTYLWEDIEVPVMEYRSREVEEALQLTTMEKWANTEIPLRKPWQP